MFYAVEYQRQRQDDNLKVTCVHWCLTEASQYQEQISKHFYMQTKYFLNNLKDPAIIFFVPSLA